MKDPNIEKIAKYYAAIIAEIGATQSPRDA